MNMLFTVSDKKGRFVTDLKKEDFEITEEKKPQADRRIRRRNRSASSARGSDRYQQRHPGTIPVSTGGGHRVHQQRHASGGPRCRGELRYRSRAGRRSDEDTAKLAQAVRALRPGGGTSFYDAIYFACRDKLQQDQPRHKFRRALIVLSDGDDNQSRSTRDQALEMAQKADVVVYGISTNNSGAEQDGDKVLKYFARETGGLVFFPFKVQDLSQSFENIANELRHQYNVLYRPEPVKADGLFHEVAIKVKNRKDLIVRARKGYYAPRS